MGRSREERTRHRIFWKSGDLLRLGQSLLITLFPSFPSQMHLNVDKQPHLVGTKVCQIYNVFYKLKHVLEKLLLNRAKKALRNFC